MSAAVPVSSSSFFSNSQYSAAVEKEAMSLYSDACALKTTCATDNKDKLCEGIKALDNRISECVQADSFKHFALDLTAMKPLLDGIVSVAKGKTSPGVLTTDQDLALRCHGIGCVLLTVFKFLNTPQSSHQYTTIDSTDPVEISQQILQRNLHPNYLFPTLTDLLKKISSVCQSQNSHDSLQTTIEIYCKAGANLSYTLHTVISSKETIVNNRVIQTLLSFGANPNLPINCRYEDPRFPLAEEIARLEEIFVPDSVISTLLNAGMGFNAEGMDVSIYQRPPLMYCSTILTSVRFISAGAQISVMEKYYQFMEPYFVNQKRQTYSNPLIIQAQEARKEVEGLQYTTQIMETIMHIEELEGTISIDIAKLIAEYSVLRPSDLYEMTMLRVYPKRPLTQ